jgi:4-hydroxy-tetrahydrodipicolinate synthase
MLTSFAADGSIDWKGIDALTDWYIDSGATGLFACCLSSEMYALTPTERLALARRVVMHSAGRVPVIATGTFGGSIDTQARFVHEMAETGVSAVVVITSQLASAGEDEAIFRARIEALLEQTAPVQLGLYECPVPYKRLLTPETLGWLAHTGRFVYLKDTSCDMTLIKPKLAAIADTPLGLYNAHTPTALTALRAGAAGVSPIAANYYPSLFAWLCARFQDEPNNAEALQHALTLMEGVARSQYPTSAKAYLAAEGMPVGLTCRENSADLSVDNELLLQALRQEVQKLVSTYLSPQ